MTAVFDHVSDWQRERGEQMRNGLSLGFVPTMGALHEGHVTLLRRSRCENDRTLVSIFVNPTQFDDPADLARYPRTIEADLEILRREGVDAVLLPTEAQIYPNGFRYRVTETALATVLEGAHRPGHFDGVLTVVLALLHIAAADRAYFGEKDWQQLELVRGMAAAFFLPTAVAGCPTVRAPDGLALSSRNRRLSAADRRTAPLLFETLSTARSAREASDRLREAGFDVEYVEDLDGRRLAAAWLGGVRLIDNVPLETRR